MHTTNKHSHLLHGRHTDANKNRNLVSSSQHTYQMSTLMTTVGLLEQAQNYTHQGQLQSQQFRTSQMHRADSDRNSSQHACHRCVQCNCFHLEHKCPRGTRCSCFC